MPKIIDSIQTVVLKTVLVIIQFSICYFAIGLFSKVLGMVTGLLSALFLLIGINSKRGYKKVARANKQYSGIPGRIQNDPEKNVVVKEWYLQ